MEVNPPKNYHDPQREGALKNKEWGALGNRTLGGVVRAMRGQVPVLNLRVIVIAKLSQGKTNSQSREFF